MFHGFSKEASRCRIEVAFDVRFHHRAIRAKLQVTCEVSDRISCPNLLPGAIAAGKKILLIDSVQYPRDRRLEEFVLCGGDAQRAQGALAFGMECLRTNVAR